MRSQGIDEAAATAWLREVLKSGQSMSAFLLTRLANLRFSTSVRAGDGAILGQRSDLRFGGTGGLTPWADMALEIATSWPEAIVVVEMPLARPGDPILGAGDIDAEFCDEEVYAVTSVTAGVDAVERVLRASDPSAPYVAMVALSFAPGDRSCPTERLRSGGVVPLRVVVGALDGEGFLVADVA